MTYPATPRTTALRMRDRVGYAHADAHAVLDEAWDCTIAFVLDGEPRALPTLHARVGDTLYLHASSGGRLGLTARATGLPVCVSVTLLDGLVYGRSQFHHSANYRSVVAHGVAALVTDPAEKLSAMNALVARLGSGRPADSRPPTRRELEQTAVLALPLREVSVRARTGGVVDDPADLALPHWAGVVPIHRVRGLPESAPGVTAPVPPYVWSFAPVLTGPRVTLSPLDVCDVDELYAATAEPAVWQHLGAGTPRTRDDMLAYVTGALRAAHEGTRVPFAIRVAGRVVGSTSYYAMDARNGRLAVGHTFLARPQWRTGVNREAKLLLLTRAFEELGCERVELHTDLRNERSQRAIEAIGATREAVLRRHRRRPDGSWRDTVLYAILAPDWPGVRTRLTPPHRPAEPVPR
jgi:RimJ/RimL family protein N-acetyltransferase/nitroimidazol reductase NimA-like FMN-containing flavoprotein (pyridoxamine 5'-phosphate oxidase superfamily)